MQNTSKTAGNTTRIASNILDGSRYYINKNNAGNELILNDVNGRPSISRRDWDYIFAYVKMQMQN